MSSSLLLRPAASISVEAAGPRRASACATRAPCAGARASRPGCSSALGCGRGPLLAARRPARGAAGRPTALSVSASGAPPKSLTLHMGETSVTFPFEPQQAKDLNAALVGVMETFKAKEKSPPKTRLPLMEYRHKGDTAAPGGIYLEVVCNPNAYATAFQAKALVTVRDDRVKLTSEAQLSALKADVEVYIGQHA